MTDTTTASTPRSAAAPVPPLPPLFGAALRAAWVRAYRHGDCHQMTAALTEALDRPTAATLHDSAAGLVHSAVILASGALLDAGGALTLAAARRRYGARGMTQEILPAAALGAYVLGEEDLVQALEVAARLSTLPPEVRQAAWRLRWTVYRDLMPPWPVAEGPLDDAFD